MRTCKYKQSAVGKQKTGTTFGLSLFDKLKTAHSTTGRFKVVMIERNQPDLADRREYPRWHFSSAGRPRAVGLDGSWSAGSWPRRRPSSTGPSRESCALSQRKFECFTNSPNRISNSRFLAFGSCHLFPMFEFFGTLSRCTSLFHTRFTLYASSLITVQTADIQRRVD